jgi:hypothetical protein
MHHQSGQAPCAATKVIALGYRPAGWDRYSDGRGRQRYTSDDGYFFIDTKGRRRAFTRSRLYTRKAIISLHGGNLALVLANFRAARRRSTFAASEVARWLAAAACDQFLLAERNGGWNPSEHGFRLDQAGLWTSMNVLGFQSKAGR